MDKKFDYSEYELGKLTYNFANLTPAEADEKRGLYEQFVREKEAAKLAQAAAKALVSTAEARPLEESGSVETPAASSAAKRPVFRPTAKSAEPVVLETPASTPDPTANATDRATTSPLADAISDKEQQSTPGEPEVKKRPVFMPTRKPAKPADPVVPATSASEPQATEAVSVSEASVPPKPRPAFRPTMKPKPAPSTNSADETSPDTSA